MEAKERDRERGGKIQRPRERRKRAEPDEHSDWNGLCTVQSKSRKQKWEEGKSARREKRQQENIAEGVTGDGRNDPWEAHHRGTRAKRDCETSAPPFAKSERRGVPHTEGLVRRKRRHRAKTGILGPSRLRVCREPERMIDRARPKKISAYEQELGLVFTMGPEEICKNET